MSRYRCESCGAALKKRGKKLSVCTYCGSSDIEPVKKSAPFPFKQKSLILSAALTGLAAVVIAVFLLYQVPVKTEIPKAAHSYKGATISKNIGIDLVHGVAWKGVVGDLEKSGFRVILIEKTIQHKILQKIDVLLIHGTTGRAFKKNEINEIQNFIKAGNKLIAAGLAWSWTYKEYGNKPLEDYPLNRLGEKLGYQITGENISEPKYMDEDLKKSVSEISRSNWAPSKVIFFNENSKVLIRDNVYQTMAGVTKLGEGTVFVCGHTAMLSENPGLLFYFLKY